MVSAWHGSLRCCSDADDAENDRRPCCRSPRAVTAVAEAVVVAAAAAVQHRAATELTWANICVVVLPDPDPRQVCVSVQQLPVSNQGFLYLIFGL